MLLDISDSLKTRLAKVWAVVVVVAWVGSIIAGVSMFWHLGGTFSEWVIFRVLEAAQ